MKTAVEIAPCKQHGRSFIAQFRHIPFAFLATIPVLVFLGTLAISDAAAQAVWSLNATSFTGYCEAYADDPDDFDPPCLVTDFQTGTIAGLFGKNEGGGSKAMCKLSVAYGPLLGYGAVRFWIDGLGTRTVTLKYVVYSKTAHKADRARFYAYGLADLLASADLKITNLPNGTPATVYYAWSAASALSNPPEGTGDDDSAYVDNTSFVLNGGALLGFGYNHFQPPNSVAQRFGGNKGSFAWTAGPTFQIAVSGSTYVKMTHPGQQYMNRDVGWAWFKGKIVLDLDSLPSEPWPPFDPSSDEQWSEFSLDIGSDTEMSDPNTDGDEVFDPGDAYPWGGPALPAGGADGSRDDAVPFASDPLPDPPFPPNTAAPTCSATPPGDVVEEYFDLDGMDAVELSMIDLIEPSVPLTDPILKFPSECIYSAEYLAISYDDDFAAHYVGDMFLCEVPVTSPTPLGTTANKDEIVALHVLSDVSPPFEAVAIGVLDEESVHQNLAPNPDADLTDNDDVDALDICADEPTCETWLFSPDHEAIYAHPLIAMPMDPGGIYEVTSGNPVQVVDEAIHLGLPEETDIEAFEFVWTVDPSSGDEVLTLLFSVDEDDYLTIDDESGGEDPGMIYASYLTGSYFPFLEDPLFYEVDAITAWKAPVYPSTCDCGVWGDVTGDGNINPVDVVFMVNFVYLGNNMIVPYANCPRDAGDVNCDGNRNPVDVVFYVNYVYLGNNMFCADPCS